MSIFNNFLNFVSKCLFKGFVEYAALKFQHFLLWQIKCQGNFIKIHFALAFPQQCFCWGRQNFILRALVFTSATPTKTLTRSKLVKLLSLLHNSPRIRSIICTIILVQIFLYKYYYMQWNALFSHVINCISKIISDALFEFKSKDKYERKMLNRLKRNFKRKFFVNSFCLMLQVLFLFGAGRWTNG